MTNSICATTVHAIRDTELACLPSGLFNTIKLKQPQVVSRLIQVLGERILGSYHRTSSPFSAGGIQTGVHLTGIDHTPSTLCLQSHPCVCVHHL